jgi:hypothetical protein
VAVSNSIALRNTQQPLHKALHMPRVATKLTPTKSGGFFARKRIPEELQMDYERRFGVRWEARFTAPPGTPIRIAYAQHREWLTEIETRIANLRAEQSGAGQSLSPKDARALAGEWYHWFVQRQEEMGTSLDHLEWLKERAYDQIRDEVLPYADNLDDDDVGAILQRCPSARADIRPFLSDVCETAQFLSARKLVLDGTSRDMFLDILFDDFFAALNLLIRRAKNDYTGDTYALQFPQFVGSTPGAISAWALFEQWVAAKKPARATVDRWRAVFLTLGEELGARSPGTLTVEEAQNWADKLVTSGRTARTVRDVWIVAARTVFGWAADRKLIAENPFAQVKVAVPRQYLKRETKAFRKDEYTIILNAAAAVADTRTAGAAAKRWVPGCARTRGRALAK